MDWKTVIQMVSTSQAHQKGHQSLDEVVMVLVLTFTWERVIKATSENPGLHGRDVRKLYRDLQGKHFLFLTITLQVSN